jgi:hypothetical protein
LEHKADVNAKDKNVETALGRAVLNGYKAVEMLLLEAQARQITRLPHDFSLYYFVLGTGG